MVRNKEQKNIIFFANTLWFLWNFKFELAKEFIKKGYFVNFVFLNDGYLSKEEKNQVEKIIQNSKIGVFNLKTYKLIRDYYNILLTYTIKCILFSPLFFYKCDLKLANYDGLGRIFSSRLFYERVFRRFLEKTYFILHNFFFHHTVVLKF